MGRRVMLCRALALAAMTLAAGPAAARAFANRPVKMVVPFAAGGVVDVMARLVVPRMGSELGQPVVVDNRPGAGATLGADIVAKSPPDGHTVLLGTIVTHATAPHLSKLPYSAEKDFLAVGFHGFNAAWLLVNPALPVTSFREFIDHARRNPGKLNYGTPSIGSSSHLSAELLKQTLNLDYQHVPYKGSTPALQDLVGGQLHFMFDNIGSSTPLVKAGKLRALAVTSSRRVASAPEVPTVAESGVAGFEVIGWAALFAPAGTPAGAVTLLNRALNAALAEPEVRQKLADVGIETRPGSPEDLARFVRAEAEKWGEVIRKGNIRAE
jgi:tripartite-type tricarboxylate transporter receptor subunit TctC